MALSPLSQEITQGSLYFLLYIILSVQKVVEMTTIQLKKLGYFNFLHIRLNIVFLFIFISFYN